MGSRLLRVLMTADAVGGVWAYALDLAVALRAHQVEVALALSGPPPSPSQGSAADRAGVELIALADALDWTARSPGEVTGAARRLAALAASRRPDIVHANSPALLAALGDGAPVVAVCHSDVKTWWQAVRDGAPLPADLAWRAALTAQGYAAADALIAPTRAFAEATAAAYSVQAPIRTVWNGRRPAGASRTPAAPAGVFAFTAGRLWDEGKGAAVLDRAARRISLPVYAAGPLDGPNGARTGLEAARALGRLDDAALAGWLAAQPIFVSPALYEPFGLAVLEAAQAGCPLVLSDIPGFRELWEGAAVLTPVSDVGALAGALESLAADPGRRALLGAAARERAARYTVEASAAGLLAVYEQLLAGRRGRAVA